MLDGRNTKRGSFKWKTDVSEPPVGGEQRAPGRQDNRLITSFVVGTPLRDRMQSISR